MSSNYSEEELNILENVENGTFVSIPDLDSEKKRYSQYAASTLRKDRRINIRMSERDLESIQRIAVEEGLPYQTLISSLIHKYINGKLVENNPRKHNA